MLVTRARLPACACRVMRRYGHEVLIVGSALLPCWQHTPICVEVGTIRICASSMPRRLRNCADWRQSNFAASKDTAALITLHTAVTPCYNIQKKPEESISGKKTCHLRKIAKHYECGYCGIVGTRTAGYWVVYFFVAIQGQFISICCGASRILFGLPRARLLAPTGP